MIRSQRVISFVLLGAALAAVCAAACGDERIRFDVPPPGFQQDGSVDAEACLFQCSLDGRSVIRSCTGEIVETCPPELACGAGVCQEPCAAAAADRSSTGCEFYLQPPLFTKRFGEECYAAFVVNTSRVPLEVSLEHEGKPLDVSRSLYRTTPGSAELTPLVGSLAPDESAVLFVSDGIDDGRVYEAPPSHCPKGSVAATSVNALPEGSGFGASFHLKTNVPVSLAAIYPYGGAAGFKPSATLLLPVATWGKEHMIVNAWELITRPGHDTGGGPGTQIVASEDGTQVTIHPTSNIEDGTGFVGTAAHIPATYRLDRGQVLQINQAAELSGSIVTSDKPTSVFGGHECMFIPSTRSACDMALQQLPSFEQWGSEYVGIGYRPRLLGNEREPMPYRIVAARDGTRLDYDPAVPPGAPLTMSAGEVVTFWPGVGDAFVVRTQDVEHPIYLAAYMAGGGATDEPDELGSMTFNTIGDPEFVNVVPAGQYLSSYSFFADPTYAETSLVIVRAKNRGAFADVWLECAGNLTGWKPVGTRGDYEWTRVDLGRRGGPGDAFDGGVCQTGLHRMRSEGPFTATIWGWDSWASYAYPGGMAQRKLVETPLAPVN